VGHVQQEEDDDEMLRFPGESQEEKTWILERRQNGNYTTAVGAAVTTAGDNAESLIFLFLPLGAGSSGGVLLYVTVLVTTDRTLTGRTQALLGVSKYLWPLLSRAHSAGENGDRMTLTVELRGESVPGEQSGEGGIRSRLRSDGERADLGWMKGEGGTAAVAEAGRDLCVSQRQEEKLLEWDVESSVVGVDLPEDSSKEKVRGRELLGLPVESTGVRVLRKSV
jgi:hypothetical protein